MSPPGCHPLCPDSLLTCKASSSDLALAGPSTMGTTWRPEPQPRPSLSRRASPGLPGHLSHGSSAQLLSSSPASYCLSGPSTAGGLRNPHVPLSLSKTEHCMHPRTLRAVTGDGSLALTRNPVYPPSPPPQRHVSPKPWGPDPMTVGPGRILSFCPFGLLRLPPLGSPSTSRDGRGGFISPLPPGTTPGRGVFLKGKMTILKYPSSSPRLLVAQRIEFWEHTEALRGPVLLPRA